MAHFLAVRAKPSTDCPFQRAAAAGREKANRGKLTRLQTGREPVSDKVDEWLEGIGLPQYRELFRAHHLDWDLLPGLDSQTLREIGVASAGHRMRLLDAAGKLAPTPPDHPIPPADPLPPPRAVDAGAERRQVTVMFCDLVGSTELSQSLDPEDLREVMLAYQDACTAAIERFEGYVARYMGDGVLAYFGYPRAFEDAAERAVRAGLAVVDAIHAIDVRPDGAARMNLKVRVGIATGPVVVGDLIGQGASQERSVVGETPNLAARLQSLAGPGAVAVAPETRALVGTRFEFEDLGVHTVKGIMRPVQAWRAIASAATVNRFETRSTGSLTRLLGRESDIRAVLDSWRSARGGEGRVVLVSGEPGIGKSRIVQAFRARIDPEKHVTLRFQCSPYHGDTSLYPVIAQMKIAAGFSPGDDAVRQHEKLAKLLGRGRASDDGALALVASLLSLPPVPGVERPHLSPPAMKAQTIDALFDQLLSLTREYPVVMELEDAHWIDPSTLDLMSRVVERLASLPLLLLVTYRPHFDCPWIADPRATSIHLDRLTPAESEAMVLELCGGRPMPAEILEEIVAKTDGVPLFVEELTKHVLESGLVAASGDRLEATGALSSIEIPSSLQDSLMARFDRLGPVKRLAQVGAAIGREFSHDLIAATAGMDAPTLDDALVELVDSELLFRREKARATTYQFKHALVQDVAYASLLKRNRRSMHLHIAEVYTEQFPEVAASQPEVLARHWSEGGRPREALLCRLTAGERASRLFSNEEAQSHFENGLSLLADLPDDEDRDRLELKLRVALGTVLRVRAGPGADPTQANYRRAVELCDRLPESADHFAALWGKWVNAMNFKLELGLQWTDRLQALAGKLDDGGFRLQAHHAQWTTLFHLGRFPDVLDHTRLGLDCYDADAHLHHAVLYGGHDPCVCGRAFAAHALWMLGAFDRSLASARACAGRGSELDHIGSRLHVIEGHLILFQFRREPEALAPWLDTLDAICAENDLPEYRGKLLFNRGWLINARGDANRGIAMMREGLENQRAVGSFEDIPMFSERLAECLAAAGEPTVGLALVDDALAIADEYSYRYWLAEIHRRRGLLHAQCGEIDAARDSLSTALGIALEQGAKTLELRARLALARHGRGDVASIGRLLESFTEGLDTVDLVEARAFSASSGVG